ncbi:MAG: hypothetical protein KY410_09200, partial [Proteobacteria bacterium]|nr:hypothetical protein [Pseudomonadota bacterium]
ALPGPIAYFCAEFGIHESMQIYSGGLGILAGDHCKSASDAALPFVAVGLLYRRGYFRQQIDADGQHDVDAVPALVAESVAHPNALVSGLPVYDDSIPANRYYGRKFNHIWTCIETLSFDIKDAMCGFRVYPVSATLEVSAEERIGARMDFDNEIMIRLYWRGTVPRFVPVRVIYPADGVSHFKLVADNMRIIAMHSRLCLGMLLRLPRTVARKLVRDSRNVREDDGNWAQQPERGNLAGMRFVAWMMRIAGTAPARALLHPVTLYFYLVHAKARHASRAYLARVHPRVTADRQHATRSNALNSYRHFLAFSRSILVKMIAWRTPGALPAANVHGRELLDDCVRSGRGMIFLSAHLGNLEMCRALAHGNPELRINALVHTRNAQKFSALMENVNPEFRKRVVLVEEMGMDTAIKLRTLLDAGEIVVMVADRTPASGNGRITHAEFLGASAPFATGPYILAHLLECPVGLLFCLPDGDDKYGVFLEPFADRITLPRAERAAHLQKWAQRFARRLESFTLQHPLQWFNFYDFWTGQTEDSALQPDPLLVTGKFDETGKG